MTDTRPTTDRRRSPLVPAAVAVVAGAIAVAGWLGTREGDPTPSASTPDAAAATSAGPDQSDASGPPVDLAEGTQAPADGAVPDQGPAATDAPEPITIGDVELTLVDE